jgi:hydroxymethylpyrimidine pyrophosphatase-like HAD family hydrolase
MKRKAIICDLDNTLTNAEHRVALAKKRQWDKFFSLAKNDTINNWCLDLMKIFEAQGYEILFVTGRPSICLKDTVDWLHQHTHFKVAMGHNLFMRTGNDRRKDFIIKEEIFKTHILPNYDVFLAVDDKPGVVKMWQKNGIIALYCGKLPEGDE